MQTISANVLKLILLISLSSLSLAFGEDIAKPPASSRCAQDHEALSGEWPVVGLDYFNSRVNLQEKKINIRNVSSLKKKWGRINHEMGGSAVHSQLTIDGKMTYAADTGGNVFALNAHTGEVIWKTRIGDQQTFVTSPTITKKTLFISGSKLYSIDRKNGRIRWQTPLYDAGQFCDQCSSNTTVVGNRVIVGVGTTSPSAAFRGAVIAFNKKTGKKVWEFFTTSDQTQPSPQFGAGHGVLSTPAIDIKNSVVYVGTGHAYNGVAGPLSNALLAIDLNNGKLLWSYQFKEGDVIDPSKISSEDNFSGHNVNSHPNLFTVKTPTGLLDLVGIGCNDGSYRIFKREQTNAAAVQSLIHLKLDPEAFLPGAVISAIVDNGVLYLSSSAFLDESGNRVSLNYAEFPPTLAQTSLKTLALDLRTLMNAGNTEGAIPRNSILWEKFTSPGIAISNSLTLANGVLYQTSWTGFIRALDARTGEELWRDIPLPIASPSYPFPAPIVGGATVVNGKVYVGLGYERYEKVLPGGGVVVYDLPKN